MAGFVAQHEADGVRDWTIFDALVEQLVVGGADDLGGEQHLDLEVKTAGAPREFEQRLRPMAPDQRAAEAVDHAFEQPRVLVFLAHEEGERGEVVGARVFRGLTEEERAAAGLAELEMGEGHGQFSAHAGSSRQGRPHSGSVRLRRLSW